MSIYNVYLLTFCSKGWPHPELTEDGASGQAADDDDQASTKYFLSARGNFENKIVRESA